MLFPFAEADFRRFTSEGGLLNSITIPITVPTSIGAISAPVTLSKPIPSALQRACLAAKTAVDNKGQDVQVLDLRKITPVFDFFVLATGPSRRVVHTIVEEVDDAMRRVGDKRTAIEGYDTSKWIVQDYGDVVVHVFDPERREYYKLEELWADAPRIDWEREIELE
jgi:ribosome-associated protein